jgi:hypothetical protein
MSKKLCPTVDFELRDCNKIRVTDTTDSFPTIIKDNVVCRTIVVTDCEGNVVDPDLKPDVYCIGIDALPEAGDAFSIKVFDVEVTYTFTPDDVVETDAETSLEEAKMLALQNIYNGLLASYNNLDECDPLFTLSYDACGESDCGIKVTGTYPGLPLEIAFNDKQGNTEVGGVTVPDYTDPPTVGTDATIFSIESSIITKDQAASCQLADHEDHVEYTIDDDQVYCATPIYTVVRGLWNQYPVSFTGTFANLEPGTVGVIELPLFPLGLFTFTITHNATDTAALFVETFNIHARAAGYDYSQVYAYHDHAGTAYILYSRDYLDQNNIANQTWPIAINNSLTTTNLFADANNGSFDNAPGTWNLDFQDNGFGAIPFTFTKLPVGIEGDGGRLTLDTTGIPGTITGGGYITHTGSNITFQANNTYEVFAWVKLDQSIWSSPGLSDQISIGLSPGSSGNITTTSSVSLSGLSLETGKWYRISTRFIVGSSNFNDFIRINLETDLDGSGSNIVVDIDEIKVRHIDQVPEPDTSPVASMGMVSLAAPGEPMEIFFGDTQCFAAMPSAQIAYNNAVAKVVKDCNQDFSDACRLRALMDAAQLQACQKDCGAAAGIIQKAQNLALSINQSCL